jgi:hypothetical protein
MAKKKKAVPKKKSAAKVSAPAKKSSAKKPGGKKTPPKKLASKKKVRAKKPATSKAPLRTSDSTLGSGTFAVGRRPRGRGLGSGAGGQSGDIQGLSRGENIDSESVEELAEEGQDFEAGVVRGIEDALDPDEAEVETEEVLEDDVPPEYDGQE